jgi:tRNA (guanine37-N1)-methyltransferase
MTVKKDCIAVQYLKSLCRKTVLKSTEKFFLFVCAWKLWKFHVVLSLLLDTGCFKKKFMRIDILTVLPEMIDGMIHCSILQRAQDRGVAEVYLHNLRDYTTDKWRRTDDYPFGGEAGMVMQIEPVDRAITKLKEEREYDEIIYTSPDGERFDQPMANRLSMLKNIIILCGHYKGVDYRIREHLVTKEISIGDYVLTGGELAAAVIADAVVRLLPGAVGDEQSALSDSFQDGLLAPPVYTRPAEYNGWKVPDLLLSGHERKIQEWRLQQAQERTERLRPDLLNNLINK